MTFAVELGDIHVQKGDSYTCNSIFSTINGKYVILNFHISSFLHSGSGDSVYSCPISVV